MTHLLKFVCFYLILPFSLISWEPDFLIVGAQKAGTTALYHFINQHPQIVKKKGEVHFFDEQFYKGVEWYQNQFSPRPTPSHLIGDKSPYYLFHPYVPERVHRLYPNVKIIVLLRNPIDRAYSQYWMNRRAHVEPLSFEDAIEAEPQRISGELDKLKSDYYPNGGPHRRFSYISRSIYIDQIKNWLKFFPKKQMLVISSTDLRKNPQGVLNKCFNFLGIPKHPVEVKNPERHSEYEPMKSETRTRLAAYFRPFNEELEQLLNRSFHWD